MEVITCLAQCFSLLLVQIIPSELNIRNHGLKLRDTGLTKATKTIGLKYKYAIKKSSQGISHTPITLSENFIPNATRNSPQSTGSGADIATQFARRNFVLNKRPLSNDRYVHKNIPVWKSAPLSVPITNTQKYQVVHTRSSESRPRRKYLHQC